MSEYYLNATSHILEYGDPNYDDEYSRPSTSTDWSIDYSVLIKASGPSIPLDCVKTHYDVEDIGDLPEGEEVYVVTAIWSTGDSFGRDDSYYAFIVFMSVSETEARDYLAKAKAADTTKFMGYPWCGYFEKLNSIELHRLPVKKDTRLE